MFAVCSARLAIPFRFVRVPLSLSSQKNNVTPQILCLSPVKQFLSEKSDKLVFSEVI